MRLLSRKLWSSYKIPPSFQVSVKFIIGTKRLLNHQISDLKNEQTNYRDLVLLDNHEDNLLSVNQESETCSSVVSEKTNRLITLSRQTMM